MPLLFIYLGIFRAVQPIIPLVLITSALEIQSICKAFTTEVKLAKREMAKLCSKS